MANNVRASETFNAFIDSLKSSISKAIEKGGTVEEMTEVALKEISFLNSGINLYFPRMIKREMKAEERKRNIIKEFNGVNHSQLALKYDVSVQWVYKILKGK